MTKFVVCTIESIAAETEQKSTGSCVRAKQRYRFDFNRLSCHTFSDISYSSSTLMFQRSATSWFKQYRCSLPVPCTFVLSSANAGCRGLRGYQHDCRGSRPFMKLVLTPNRTILSMIYHALLSILVMLATLWKS